MRLIDADYITNELGATCIAKRNDRGNLIPLGNIDCIPTINPLDKGVIEVTTGFRFGKWECQYEEIEHDGYTEHIPHTKCSVCSFEYDSHSVQFINYCPHCGAYMREIKPPKGNTIIIPPILLGEENAE